MRGNDVVFAVHALLLSIITLSQFWGRLWGLEQGGKRAGGTVGRPVWLIVGISVIGVAWTVVQVLTENGATTTASKGGAGRAEKEMTANWEWIDVVRENRRFLCFPQLPAMLSRVIEADRCDVVGLCYRICQAGCDCNEVYPTSMGELQEKVNGRMEYLADIDGSVGRCVVDRAAGH